MPTVTAAAVILLTLSGIIRTWPPRSLARHPPLVVLEPQAPRRRRRPHAPLARYNHVRRVRPPRLRESSRLRVGAAFTSPRVTAARSLAFARRPHLPIVNCHLPFPPGGPPMPSCDAATPICQSCGLPLADPADCGTEADGSASQEYCQFCYQQGSFTAPNLALGRHDQQTDPVRPPPEPHRGPGPRASRADLASAQAVETLVRAPRTSPLPRTSPPYHTPPRRSCGKGVHHAPSPTRSAPPHRRACFASFPSPSPGPSRGLPRPPRHSLWHDNLHYVGIVSPVAALVAVTLGLTIFFGLRRRGRRL